MQPGNKKLVLLLAAVVFGAFAVIGLVLEDGAGEGAGAEITSSASSSGAAEARPPQAALDFTRWSHASGLFSAEVPAGWRVEGELGDAMDQGQFKLQAYSPDGASLISFAHNWLSFMEFQYGLYQPGAATVERIVLPQFLLQQPGYTGAHVVYRSANQRLQMPNPMTGLSIPFDSGTLGFLLARSAGGFAAGTAMGETMYVATPGTPGLWRLRLFAAVLAPGDAVSQANGRAALDRAVATLQLSEQFFQLWYQAFDQTARQMRAYSAQMDRVFNRYLASAGRSSSSDGDPMEGWATMMRGGEYAQDDTTGEQYWIGNDNDYWFVNDRGDVVGNDTGEAPTNAGSWRILRGVGQ